MVRSLCEGLSNPKFRLSLRPRHSPYYCRLSVGRFLGYHKPRPGSGYWAARIRLRGQSNYHQSRLALADDLQEPDGRSILSYSQAVSKAQEWFSAPKQSAESCDTKPNGPCTELIFCPVGPEYTVGHAVADFVEWKRVFGARQSWLSSIAMANKYILPLLGTVAARDLTAEDLRKLIRLVESTPAAHGGKRFDPVDPETMDPEMRRRRRVSANNNYTLLRTALNMAWQEGKVEDDRPWRRVNRFRAVNQARPDMLSWEQCRALLQASEPELQRVILGALYTGCRITELFNIRAEDLHRGRWAIYIRPFKVYRARHIALPEEGYTFFENLAYGKGPRAILVVRDSGDLWNRSTCLQRLKQACQKAGLPRHIIFHTFRHTYASLLLQAGTSPIVVARQLGHADLTTVLKTYAHCTDDFIDRELRDKYRPGFANLVKTPQRKAHNDNRPSASLG